MIVDYEVSIYYDFKNGLRLTIDRQTGQNKMPKIIRSGDINTFLKTKPAFFYTARYIFQFEYTCNFLKTTTPLWPILSFTFVYLHNLCYTSDTEKQVLQYSV